MTDPDRVTRRHMAGVAAFVASVGLILAGSGAIAAETCAWTKAPSGADLGACVDAGHKAYCVSCQYAPRVCVRTPC